MNAIDRPAAPDAREFALDRRTAQFLLRTTESAFRATIANTELAAFRRAMLVCGPLYFAFIVSDYLQLGAAPAFWGIFAARGAVCLLALLLAARFRPRTAADGAVVGAAYAAARVFFAAAVGLAFVIYFLYGKDYVELYPGVIVMVMVGFFFVPARFVDRLAATTIVVVGFNVEGVLWMRPPAHQLPFALLLMLATLVLGAVAARRGALLRRRHFVDTVLLRRLNTRLAHEAEARLRLQQEAIALAHTDALTGIANRRHFLEAAEAECARSGRYGGPLAALVLDVDHFKAVNDRHGHAVGDAALVAVARTCAAQLRLADLIGRIGGEEFAMLLPHTDAAGAAALAERLRAAVAALRTDPMAGPLTVTIGVAAWRGADDDLGALLHRADEALYQGKSAGRNRVALAAA